MKDSEVSTQTSNTSNGRLTIAAIFSVRFPYRQRRPNRNLLILCGTAGHRSSDLSGYFHSYFVPQVATDAPTGAPSKCWLPPDVDGQNGPTGLSFRSLARRSSEAGEGTTRIPNFKSQGSTSLVGHGLESSRNAFSTRTLVHCASLSGRAGARQSLPYDR